MASSTSAYSFTDEEVSQLANCNDQDEFLHFFQRILQSKGIDITAVFDAQTTLGSSTDYGASILTRFFENQSHALHLEVGYALFKSCNSSTCLSWDSTSLPKSWLKEHGVDSYLNVPPASLALFTAAGIDLKAVRSLSADAASATSPSSMPSAFEGFFQRSTAIDHLLVRFSGTTSTHRDELATLLSLPAPDPSDDHFTRNLKRRSC